MSQINDIVKESLEVFNESIRLEMNNKNMDASGTAKNSLRVEEKGYIISSVGIDYIQYLNRGRPPGKFPPMNVIAQWVDLKGLQVDPYVIARGIANQGTRIFRNRELGLKLEEKTEKLKEALNEKLPNFISNQIVTQLNNAFKSK